MTRGFENGSTILVDVYDAAQDRLMEIPGTFVEWRDGGVVMQDSVGKVTYWPQHMLWSVRRVDQQL